MSKAIVWYLVCLGLMACSLASADVWGIKSHDPLSQPPATLFRFAENGTSLTTIGVITLAGVQIDTDALAITPDGTLYAFRVKCPGSQMVTLDPTTAVATAVGPVIAVRDIRGAVFTHDGRLLTIDAAQDALVEFDPATGMPLGTPLPLTLYGAAFDTTDVCDLAQHPGGMLIAAIGGGGSLYTLDEKTGELRFLNRDSLPAGDGYPPSIAGLAFSADASVLETLFVYDVTMNDDIFTYAMGSGYTRAYLYPNIIPSYNAGRGDLAAQADVTIPEMTSPVDFLNPGWNWFSVPLIPRPDAVTSIFGSFDVTNRLYRWDSVGKTVLLYADDFQRLNADESYVTLLDTTTQVTVSGYVTPDRYPIPTLAQGWTWIGFCKPVACPLAGTVLRNRSNGEYRTAAQDYAAAAPWINWNWIYWDAAADTARILGLPGVGSDDTILRPWCGYRVWVNAENIDVIYGE